MKILNMFLCSLLVLFSVGTSFAYTDTELKNKTEAYERVLSSKYEVKIAKFSQRTLEKISTLIVERLLKVEDNPDMEDIKKLKTVALYNALKNIVDNYYDVTDELEDVINISVLNVTIIDDKRCKNCQTEEIIEQLKRVSVLADALFITKDFSDEGVRAYLKDNGITALPAAIFSHNDVGSDFTQYLTPLSSEEYSLALGASFDPFLQRSTNGFMTLDKNILEEIQNTAYFRGPTDTNITWIEYTDVNCHFCKKMEADGTADTVFAKFPGTLNKTSTNYIGVGGAATQKAAEILECTGKSGGADLYNTMLSQVLTDGDNSENTMLAIATDLGLNKDTIKSCLDNGDMKTRVAEKFAIGTRVFKITGTPGNVLINNETGEYTIVSGAYPASHFIETIQSLSK